MKSESIDLEMIKKWLEEIDEYIDELDDLFTQLEDVTNSIGEKIYDIQLLLKEIKEKTDGG